MMAVYVLFIYFKRGIEWTTHIFEENEYIMVKDIYSSKSLV